jgi:hypothetical protein
LGWFGYHHERACSSNALCNERFALILSFLSRLFLLLFLLLLFFLFLRVFDFLPFLLRLLFFRLFGIRESGDVAVAVVVVAGDR